MPAQATSCWRIAARLRDFGNKAQLGPIFDVTPEAGQAAELVFASQYLGSFPLLGRLVRTPGGYGLRIAGNGLPEINILRVETYLVGSAGGSQPRSGARSPLRSNYAHPTLDL